jgi:tetratricopeptide (TPR) repeat protein
MTHRPTPPDATNDRARLTQGGADTPDELAIAALIARLPSAAPDDLAVERVWRRVTAPAKHPSRSALPLWIPAVALSALLLVVLAVPKLWTSGAAVEIALSSGGVFSSNLAQSWHPSQNGEALAEASRVRTDTTGRAVFRVRGVAAVLLAEGSDVGIERLSQGTFLRLSQGSLTARVAKRKADEPFVVETDRFAVKVVGTLFTVEQGPGDHTAVSVREGVVDVSDGLGRVDRVLAGQRWTSDSRDTRTIDRTADAVKALLDGGLEGRSSADLAGPFAAATPVPARQPSTVAPQAARALAPAATRPGAAPLDRKETAAQEIARRDQAAAAPAKDPTIAPQPVATAQLAPPAAPSPAAEVAPEAPAQAETTAVNPQPATDVPPPAETAAPATTPPPPVASTPVDEGPYARGLALEARGDFEAAARELARAADTDPRYGDIALYALGRLAQRRLHDVGRARSAFNRYRARYPHGTLLPEVDLAILEIEVETHAQSDALADSTRFLAAHPTSERVVEVHLLRGNLLRDAGRCQEALADYAAVRSGPLADDALYSTAYCQRELGDRITAARTLRDYLARFPRGAHRAEAEQALAESHE